MPRLVALSVVAIVIGWSILTISRHAHARVESPPPAATNAKPALAENYGNLALSFEAGSGQSGGDQEFFARGKGYAIGLSAQGASLALHHRSADKAEPNSVKTALIQMNVLGGQHASPRGLDQLPGKVNYLIGNDPRRWRTDVSTFARVLYQEAYPGIDLIYYGNQHELEYDFRVAAGANPKQIALQMTGAQTLRVDRTGDLLVKTPEGEIKLLKPVAFQEKTGTRERVECKYELVRHNEIHFRLGPYDHSVPLVIDPVLAYSTFLGGADDDQAFGIAVDSAGNAYITGEAFSADFPSTTGQGPKSGNYDAFVTKLNSTGSAIIYSTFLGGVGFESGNAITVDAAGNAFVAGQTTSADFPLVNPVHPNFRGLSDAFVAELNPAGSSIVYSTYLGGSSFDSANGIAIDATGNTYLTGEADSRDFPTTNAFQNSKLGSALFQTTDAANSWALSQTGLTGAVVNSIAFSPGNSSIVYAGCDNGIFMSTDGGNTWTGLAIGQVGISVQNLAIDPGNPQIIYAGSASGFYKSTDGGAHFTLIGGSGLFPGGTRSVLVDPSNSNNLYVASLASNLVFHSSDAGASWSSGFSSGFTLVNTLAISGGNPSTLYAGTNRGVWKSSNGGLSWSPTTGGLQSQFDSVRVIGIDKNNPSLMYYGASTGFYKSTDGGTNWIKNSALGTVSVGTIVLDPTNTSVIFLASGSQIQKTTDGGSTWTVATNGYSNTTVNSLVLDPSNSSKLLVGTTSDAEAFVAKLSPNGTQEIYSTYLGGSSSDVGASIAADPAGNAYVTGATRSTNFPVLNPRQSFDGNDAFVAKFGPTGALLNSSALGGNGVNSGNAIGLDSANNVYVAGYTSAVLFPGASGMEPTITGGTSNDVFVTKLNPALSTIVYTRSIGGNSSDQCFGMAVDPAGPVYITGTTSSTGFPVAAAPQPTKAAASDAFVTKLAADGTIAYSTFLGGNGNDTGWAIAVDGGGNAYVAGSTNSSTFPTVNPIRQTLGGVFDAFVSKLVSSPDLVVTMTDSPDPVKLGDNVTYSLTVANNGDAGATGVTLVDTVPAGGSVVSASSGQGTCTIGSVVSCALGNLGSGASTSITVVLRPPASATITNTASVSANEADSNTANNTASQSTAVSFDELALDYSASVDFASAGSNVAYFVGVTNKATTIANGININVTLPAGVTFVSCNAGGGPCGGSGANRTIAFSALSPGASAGAIIIVTIDNSDSAGAVLNSAASVNSTLPDSNLNNNSATASVTVSTSLVSARRNGKIVYSTDQTGTLGLRTINSDGTGITMLTNAQNYERRPAWSPDGRIAAFQSFSPGGVSPAPYEISVVNAAGTGRTKLSIIAAQDARPTWSPNGKRIAFIGSDFSIYSVAVTGGSSIRVITGGAPIRQLDWSPDGTRLAFENSGEIYSVTLAGVQTKLTNHPGQNLDSNPRWSADGSRVLFTRNARPWVVNSDATNEHLLLDQAGANFAWSPDNLRLVFELGGEINVVNTNGSGLLQLTNNNSTPGSVSYKFEPDWQPLAVVNPIDNPPTFVRQNYLDFLSREPDLSGLGFWTDQIKACGTDPACIEVHRINVSGAFFLSIEFQQTGYLVERIYKTAYGDATGTSTFGASHQLAVPVVRFNEFLPDTQAIGQGVVVLAQGWEQALETNKQNFVNAFVQRARFLTDYPANMSAADFVDKLNSRAGSPLSSAERNQLVSDLGSNVKTRAQVLRAIAEHPNLVSAEVNRAFVLMQYFGYLRRNPNDAPDTDYSGYDFWLSKLNQFNGDYVGAEMVKAFISSGEYRSRFGP